MLSYVCKILAREGKGKKGILMEYSISHAFDKVIND